MKKWGKEMSKSFDFLIRLKTQMDKTLPKNLEELSNKTENLKSKTKELDSLQKQIKGIEKTQKNYETLKKSIGENIEKYRKNRTELKRLETIKQKDGELTKKQEARIEALTKQQEKLTRTIEKQRVSYKNYKIDLERLKTPLKNLKDEAKKLTNELSRVKAQEKLAGIGGNLKKSIGNKANSIKNGAISLAKKAVVGGAVATVGAGAYIGVNSAKTYIDFDANMRKVKAISGATAEEFKRLEAEAMRLGATTKFTAGEAAAAMEKMALAGFKTNDIVAGMGGVLDLAAAAGEDVAMVSDIITDNLTAFKMSAKDTGRFADVMAWGMSRTNVTVEMLGESFKYMAGQAGTLGVSLEESVGALGLLGDQAIKSGMAGRGLNETFSRLVKNKDDLKKMGINIANSKGEFIGLVEVVKQFEKKTKKMTGIEKTAFLKDIFGEQGERSFSKLLSAQKVIDGVEYTGAEALEKTIESAKKDSVGLAGKMRDEMLQGASGAMILLDSAWDGVKISLGKLIFNETVIDWLKKLTDYIGEFANALNGVFNVESKASLFWKETFSKSREYIKKIKEILEPAKNAIMEMFPSSSDIQSKLSFLADVGIFIAKVINFIVVTISKIKKVIDFIGIDNILVFVSAFMTVYKVVKVIQKVHSAFLLLKSAGGVLIGLKTMLLPLFANPIALIIAGVVAALVLLGYMIYKHFDKIKKALLFLKDVFVKIFTGIKNFIFVFVKNNYLFKLVEGVIAFYNAWDSKKSIIENIKAGFIAFFDVFKNWAPVRIIAQLFEKIREKINSIEPLKKVITSIFDSFPIFKMLGVIRDFYDAWDSKKSIIENIKAGFIRLFETFDWLPVNLVVKFFEVFSSNESIIEKIKNCFRLFFDEITERIDKIKNSFSSIFDRVKNIDITGKLGDIKARVTSFVSGNSNIEINGSHKTGLDYVPFDGYIAELHRGERVLTATENKEYGTLTNGNKLFKSKKNIVKENSTESSKNIIFNPNITINTSTQNSEELARALENKIKELSDEFLRKIKELERREANAKRTAF